MTGDALYPDLKHVAGDHRRPLPAHTDVHLEDSLVGGLMAGLTIKLSIATGRMRLRHLRRRRLRETL
jgi:hypothetical protein